jgi:hypothetical protein
MYSPFERTVRSPMYTVKGREERQEGSRRLSHESAVRFRPGPLQWASYEGPGTLTRSTFGVREPTGRRLGVDVISRADLILLPALAVDRRGSGSGKAVGITTAACRLLRSTSLSSS